MKFCRTRRRYNRDVSPLRRIQPRENEVRPRAGLTQVESGLVPDALELCSPQALGAEDPSLRLRFGSQVDDFNAAVVLAPLVGDVGIYRARLSKADRLEPRLIDAGVCKVVLHHFCTTL